MNKIIKVVFFLSIISISGFLLSGCTTSEEKVSEYNKQISEVDVLIESMEYNLALEKLSKTSELIPSRIDAYQRIVDIFITKNRLEDATKILDESATKLEDSDRGSLYVDIGNAYYLLKDFDKALYNYQIGKGFDSSNTVASLGIAKVYIQKGNIEGAKKLLDSKYEGDEYIESQLLLSYLYSLNSVESAIDAIKDVEPGDDWRGKYTDWSKLLEGLTDDELFNSAKLGKVYMDEGYPYLSIAILEPNKDKMLEYMDGIYILGKAYYEQGEYQKSIDLLEDGVFVSNLNQYVYWVLARDYYMLDDLETSFSYYETALSYGGDYAEQDLYMEYLDFLFEENQTEKALEVMRRAERIFDRDWVKLYYMELYTLRKDFEKFEYHMESVDYSKLENELKSDYLYVKGDYFIQNNQLDDAKRTLDLFWELDPYDARYNLLVAELSFQEGNLDDSRIYSKKAIEYDTEREVTEQALKLLAQID